MRLTNLFENSHKAKDLSEVFYNSATFREFAEDPNYFMKRHCLIEIYDGGFLIGSNTDKLKLLSTPPVMQGLAYVPLIVLALLTNNNGIESMQITSVDMHLQLPEDDIHKYHPSTQAIERNFNQLVYQLRKYYTGRHELADVKSSEDVEHMVEDLVDAIVEFAYSLEEYDLTYAQIWGRTGASKLRMYINTVITFLYENKKHLS